LAKNGDISTTQANRKESQVIVSFSEDSMQERLVTGHNGKTVVMRDDKGLYDNIKN